MEQRQLIAERLRAYIHPNAVETAEQEAAFARAVDAQLAYEAEQGGEIPGNAQSFSVGNYSVTLAEPSGGAYSQATIAPAAWAILFNAGLLRRDLPVARRL